MAVNKREIAYSVYEMLAEGWLEYDG